MGYHSKLVKTLKSACTLVTVLGISFGLFKETAHAEFSRRSGSIEINHCPGAIKDSKSGLIICSKVTGAFELSRIPLSPANKLPSLPNFVEFHDIVELGLWPDDSTNLIYLYASTLKANNRVVGYVAVHGYVNSEMGIKTQLITKYNLSGKMVSVSEK